MSSYHSLRAYEERTESLRNGETKLFLGLIKLYKLATSCTVAQWLKALLQAAGVDTSIFSAHLVRGASSFKAANIGTTTKGSKLEHRVGISKVLLQANSVSYGRAVLQLIISYKQHC